MSKISLEKAIKIIQSAAFLEINNNYVVVGTIKDGHTFLVIDSEPDGMAIHLEFPEELNQSIEIVDSSMYMYALNKKLSEQHKSKIIEQVVITPLFVHNLESDLLSKGTPDNSHSWKVETTDRGFEIMKFLDYYHKQCSLQQSSAAINSEPGTGAIWLGRNELRMHLDRALATKVVYYLKKWLATGSFK